MPQAPDLVKQLVERFDRNIYDYKNSTYKEAHVRQEFINRFWSALGCVFLLLLIPTISFAQVKMNDTRAQALTALRYATAEIDSFNMPYGEFRYSAKGISIDKHIFAVTIDLDTSGHVYRWQLTSDEIDVGLFIRSFAGDLASDKCKKHTREPGFVSALLSYPDFDQYLTYNELEKHLILECVKPGAKPKSKSPIN
jgi:hypothetical protein